MNLKSKSKSINNMKIIVKLKGVGRAYGNSFFKVINVTNKRKCQKEMYSIVSHII